MRIALRVLFVLSASAILAPTARCGHQFAEAKTETPVTTPFDKGRHELQVGAGAFFSFHNRSEERPTNNDADLSVRLGCMLYSPRGPGFLRGNTELLGEAFGAWVFDGPGNYLTGLTLLVRYNFVQPESKWIPYFQGGVGGLYNDIYREEPQRRVGQGFEFNLQGTLGLRYLCSDHCAAFLEATYRHISNADNADRNLGLNSWGGLLGVSYFF